MTAVVPGAVMNSDTLKALVAFYADSGVDCAIDEMAVDHWSSATAPMPVPARPVPAGPPIANALAERRSTPPAPDIAAKSARSLAASANDLDALRHAIDAFEGCALRQTATQTVFEGGTRGARLMLVGEAPGRDEDMEGVPFVGRSGQLLDRMLASIGLDRSKVYIANLIPWRPPGNRTPTPQEITMCLPFIERQIVLAAPELLVCLGAPATQTLLQTRDSISKMRGRLLVARPWDREIPAIATFHPAYLLRTPIAKRQAWRDLLAIRAFLARGDAVS